MTIDLSPDEVKMVLSAVKYQRDVVAFRLGSNWSRINEESRNAAIKLIKMSDEIYQKIKLASEQNEKLNPIT